MNEIYQFLWLFSWPAGFEQAETEIYLKVGSVGDGRRLERGK